MSKTENILGEKGLKPWDGVTTWKELTLHMFPVIPDDIKDYPIETLRVTNSADISAIFKNPHITKLIINSCPGVYIPKTICKLKKLKTFESAQSRIFNLKNLELSHVTKVELDNVIRQIDEFPDKQFEKLVMKDITMTCPFPAPIADFEAHSCPNLYNIPVCTKLKAERCNFATPLDMTIIRGTTHVRFNDCFHRISEYDKHPLIKEFTEVPCSVRELELIKCGITKLPDNIGEATNLTHLDITDNKITKLPLEITRLRLEIFQYNGNQISNINNPLIQRWLRRANQGKRGRLTYEDTQNVHNNEIQENVRNSIMAIMKEYNGEIVDYHADKDIPNDIKPILDNLIRDTNGYYCQATYANIVNAVLHIVNQCPNAKDIKQHSLKSEVLDSVNVCFTGRVSRMVNVLAGHREDLVKIGISDSQQMQNIMTMLARNARNDMEFDVLSKEAKEKFLNKLKAEYAERKYAKDDVDASLEFADYFWDDMYGSPDGAEEERREEEATANAIAAVAAATGAAAAQAD